MCTQTGITLRPMPPLERSTAPEVVVTVISIVLMAWVLSNTITLRLIRPLERSTAPDMSLIGLFVTRLGLG